MITITFVLLWSLLNSIKVYFVLGSITFDTGFNNKWNFQTTSGFNCVPSNSPWSQLVSFSQQFARIPQVFMAIELLDDSASGSLGGYNITITTVTLSGNQQLNQILLFQWSAIQKFGEQISIGRYDDLRIQVINYFSQQPITKIFEHTNRNFNKYFISLLGLTFSGLVDFRLQVDSLTSTDVTVSITDPTGKLTNLQYISYQLILGTDEAFTSSALIYSGQTYSLDLLNLVSNRKLCVPFAGFTVTCPPSCTRTIQVQKVYTTTSTTVSYQISKWDSNPYSTSNYHQQIWLIQTFLLPFKSIQCGKVRMASYIVLENFPASQFQVYLADSIYSSQGTYSIIIPKTTTIISLEVQHLCIFNSKIVTQLLKCQSCTNNQYYKFNHYCHSQVNTIYLESRFVPQSQSVQEVQLIIANNNCKIIQLCSLKKILIIKSTLQNYDIEQIKIFEMQVT